MQENLITICALWLIYGFFGFIVETIYCSIGQRKFVERGFLTGPIIPIYAFGAMIILYVLEPVSDNMLLVFIFGVILTSILEYIGSYLMEKLFNLKLWDYSKQFMNINGRVCLKNSTLFGLLSVALIFYINPPILNGLHNMNQSLLTALTVILMVVTAIDFTFSTLAAMHIRVHLDLIEEFKDKVSESSTAKLEKHAHRYKFFKERLYRAFPNMTSEQIDNVVTELRRTYEEAKKNSLKR